MIFKSSTVALVVSSVFALNANATDAELANQKLSVGNTAVSALDKSSDVKSAFVTSKNSSGVYLIRLSEKSALDASYAKLGDNRSSVVANIDKQHIFGSAMAMMALHAMEAMKAKQTNNTKAKRAMKSMKARQTNAAKSMNGEGASNQGDESQCGQLRISNELDMATTIDLRDFTCRFERPTPRVRATCLTK